MNVNTYNTSGGKDKIWDYINSLPEDERVHIKVALHNIQKSGLEAMEIISTRQIYKKLWEMKLSQHRLFYIIPDGDNVYILHACKKQKGKAELHELETAKKRAKELEEYLNKSFV